MNSYTHPVRINHMTRLEGSVPEDRHITAPAPPFPPTVPITVIPIPLVSSTPTALPTSISPSIAPCLTPPKKDVHFLPKQQALHQHPLISSQVKAEPISLFKFNGNNPQPPQQLQPYPGSIITATQNALLPHSGLPLTQPSPATRGSPPDDHNNIDGKKRPGG